MNAEPSSTPGSPSHQWFVDRFRDAADRFAVAIDGADPTAPVPTCPGWDVSQLTEHLGQVHRWAAWCTRHGRRPTREERAGLGPFEPEHLASWYRGTAHELVTVLASLDPATPTWHPFPVAQVAGVWPRRQLYETTIHRVDAELATGREPGPIDPMVAADAIDEYFELIVPRMAALGTELPAGSLHVHCTDVAGEWLVDASADYRFERVHAKGAAALRGPAEALLLTLWGRRHDDPRLDQIGDDAVLGAWLAVGGV